MRNQTSNEISLEGDARVADRAAGVADPVKVVAGLAGPATGCPLNVTLECGSAQMGEHHFTRELTRSEADIAVRQFVDLFYQEHGIEYTPDAFANFRRELSWKVGADFRNDSVLEDAIEALFNLDLLECCTHPDLAESRDLTDSNRPELLDRFEDDFGTAINVALDEAHVFGDWIIRRGEFACAA